MEPQTHEELVAMTGTATKYEVVSKETGEVFPVDRYQAESDRTMVVHLADGTPVSFSYPERENEIYTIREVGTELEAEVE
jgi:hypothetical protein